MSDILKKICGDKLEHIAECKRQRPESQLVEDVRNVLPTRGFAAALNNKVEAGSYALIAEIKKASPSKGLIREDFHPAELARSYEAGGAACLSVLTDVPYFQGDDLFIGQARDACSLPVLRKDFMLDVYQVTEARLLGADCILLIMAALDDAMAKDLEQAAFDLGMDVLVEVHNQEELVRALDLKSPLLGVNNRNLKTLEIDIATTEALAPMVPEDRVLICESGLYSSGDLLRMSRSGARRFLIGESLMRQDDVETATKSILFQGVE